MWDDDELPSKASFGTSGRATLTDSQGEVVLVSSRTSGRKATWRLHNDPRTEPLRLEIETPDDRLALITIPGNIRRISTHAITTPRQQRIIYKVRMQSDQPAQDTILNYLRLGKMDAAQGMLPWAPTSEQLLSDKRSDPYAAAVGAYLLLRLQHFELLHDWPRNLADWMEFLPDGCVIWATQLMRQKPESVDEIRTYLLRAVGRGLPVFTEGLRLLLDGLVLLGKDGEAAHRKVREQAGATRWESPLALRITTGAESGRRSMITITYDIGFGLPI